MGGRVHRRVGRSPRAGGRRRGRPRRGPGASRKGCRQPVRTLIPSTGPSRGRCRSGSTVRWRVAAPGTSCSRGPKVVLWGRSADSTRSRTWASTSSTSRPSTPSVAASEGARQHARGRAARPREPVGDRHVGGRAHRGAPRPRHHRRLRRVRRRGRGRGAWKWPSTTPCSAHRTTPGSPSTPSGSTTGPTAPSATRRTRRRSTRTSTRSPSGPRRPTAPAVGRVQGHRRVLGGPPGDPGSSTSTIPIRSPSRSGTGCWPRSGEGVPDVVFLAEAFTRPTVMARLGEVGFSQSYTYFTWRNQAGRAPRLHPGAGLRPHGGVPAPHLLADHPRHPLWPAAQRHPRPMFELRAVLAARAVAELRDYPRLRVVRERADEGKTPVRRTREVRARGRLRRHGLARRFIGRLNAIRPAHPASTSCATNH